MITMKAIITADSEILDKRLLTILTGIPGLEIITSVRDVQEAFVFVKEYNPDLLIISPNQLTSAAFDVLREIKIYNDKLIIIALTENVSLEYTKVWELAGANFVFDQALQLNRMVEVLCSLLYSKQFNALLSSDSPEKK